MRNIFKKILAAVMALAVAATVFVFNVPKKMAQAATEHTHKFCVGSDCNDNSHADITWTGISDLSNLNSGNYYLTSDITLSSSQIEISSGTDIKLCLNGHTITAKSGTEANRIFCIERRGSLTLCDCKNNTGKLTGGLTIRSANSNEKDGGAVYLNGGSFTMYGGTISGNKVNTSGKSEEIGAGGGVYVSSGTFIMNGGVISNNSSLQRGSGGGISMDGGTFTMNGGTISQNTSSDGGGVNVEGGTFIMNGGTISQNTSSDDFGGGSGGGVSNSGTFTMNNGEISGNKAKSGGGVYVAASQGATTANFTMNGGTISDDQAKGNGGGAYTTNNIKFTMKGGTISDNQAEENGGGAYLAYGKGKGPVTLDGKVEITGNTTTTNTSNNGAVKKL